MSINFDQLKNIYNTTGGVPDTEITLCYSKKEVFIKPLKVKDKKDLLKAIETKNEDIVNKKLDEIIIKYVEAKDGSNIDYEKLSTAERHQIMVYIRIAAGGDTANIVHQCPNCEVVNRNIQYDLNNLYLKEYNLNKEDAMIPVGNGSIKIELGPISRTIEREVEKYIKVNKIKSESEKQLALVASHIKEVWIDNDDGETDKVDFKNIEEKVQFFDSLQGRDSNNVIEKMNECLDFGIKMPFKFVCDSCGYSSEEEVNVAAFFIS